MIVKSFAALAVTALALQALPAKAQDSTSSSGSTSSSSSSSGAVSGSRSSTGSATSGTSGNFQQLRTNQRTTTNNNIPITFNSVDPAGERREREQWRRVAMAMAVSHRAVRPARPTTIRVTHVRTTPTVYAPPVSGGNPCTLQSQVVSAYRLGRQRRHVRRQGLCRRQKIAMIHNAGRADVAFELMCNDRATYMAFRGTDKPCNPRPEFDGPPTMAQQPAPPTVITPPPQQQVIMKDKSNLPRCSRTVTDNCFAG